MQRGVFILILLILTVFSYATEKYAVIIGINDYMNDRIQDLRYSEADADYLADVLFR